jgi:hypothetical protein
MNPVVKRALPWIALGLLVLVALLVGPQLLLRGAGPAPGEYDVVFPSAGQYEAGVPVYEQGQTFAAFLSPAEAAGAAAVPELAVAAVDPLGHPVVLSDRLRARSAGGTFDVEGDVTALFGEQTGTWRVLFVLSPSGSEPADRLVTRHAWEIKARPDGSVDWPGNRRVIIRSIVLR